jgi:hypothetical protein
MTDLSLSTDFKKLILKRTVLGRRCEPQKLFCIWSVYKNMSRVNEWNLSSLYHLSGKICSHRYQAYEQKHASIRNKTKRIRVYTCYLIWFVFNYLQYRKMRYQKHISTLNKVIKKKSHLKSFTLPVCLNVSKTECKEHIKILVTWPKPCMHIWIIKQTNKNTGYIAGSTYTFIYWQYKKMYWCQYKTIL